MSIRVKLNFEQVLVDRYWCDQCLTSGGLKIHYVTWFGDGPAPEFAPTRSIETCSGCDDDE